MTADQKSEQINPLQHFNELTTRLDEYTALEPSARPEELRRSIIQSVDYAVKNFLVWRQQSDGTQLAYIGDPSSDAIDHETSAIAQSALEKFSDLMRTQKYLPLTKALARGADFARSETPPFSCKYHAVERARQNIFWRQCQYRAAYESRCA